MVAVAWSPVLAAVDWPLGSLIFGFFFVIHSDIYIFTYKKSLVIPKKSCRGRGQKLWNEKVEPRIVTLFSI
jgi:hypothetical protein